MKRFDLSKNLAKNQPPSGGMAKLCLDNSTVFRDVPKPLNLCWFHTGSAGIQDVADSGGSSSLASLTDSERAEIDGKFVSAFIRAQKAF